MRRRLTIRIPFTGYCTVETEVELTDVEAAQAKAGSGPGYKKAVDAALEEDFSVEDANEVNFHRSVSTGWNNHATLNDATVDKVTAALDTTRTRNTTLAAIWFGGEVVAFGSFPGAADDALEAVLEWAFDFARAHGWELVSE